MAGRGSRFTDAGYSVAKPLIDVNNLPMYARAVSSLPVNKCAQIIFVCLKEHLLDGTLEQDILTRYSDFNCKILDIPEVTRGQSETVYLTRHLIPDNHSLLIYNADTYFKSDLSNVISGLDSSARGIITVFQAAGEHWSFAKINSSGSISEVREKVRISPWATTGMYFFTSAKDFFELAGESIEKNERYNNEFYVAPLFNKLIEDGGVIVPDYAQVVYCMGTPAELEETLSKRVWNNERNTDCR